MLIRFNGAPRADVHFPCMQPQAPQARAAFSTQVLFWGTPPSATEVHWRYEPAQCAMSDAYGDVPAPPQLSGSELRSRSRHAYEPGARALDMKVLQ